MSEVALTDEEGGAYATTALERNEKHETHESNRHDMKGHDKK